ncbi:anaphase promoting complex subunit cdc16, partial [Quaeritorhiza haematococci]
MPQNKSSTSSSSSSYGQRATSANYRSTRRGAAAAGSSSSSSAAPTTSSSSSTAASAPTESRIPASISSRLPRNASTIPAGTTTSTNNTTNSTTATAVGGQTRGDHPTDDSQSSSSKGLPPQLIGTAPTLPTTNIAGDMDHTLFNLDTTCTNLFSSTSTGVSTQLLSRFQQSLPAPTHIPSTNPSSSSSTTAISAGSGSGSTVIDRLRQWRQDAIQQHLYSTAAFWADKVVSIAGDPSDTYWLAQIFYLTGQYTRAEKLLSPFVEFPRSYGVLSSQQPHSDHPPSQNPLHQHQHQQHFQNQFFSQQQQHQQQQTKQQGKSTFENADSIFLATTQHTHPQHVSNGIYGQQQQNQQNQQRGGHKRWQVAPSEELVLTCRHLAALCAMKLNKPQEALDILGESEDSPISTNLFNQGSKPYTSHIRIEASIRHLCGLLYSTLNSTDRAKACFREALQIDSRCFEAFQALIGNHMLTGEEERQLLESLDFEASCGSDADLVRLLYQSKLKKYGQTAHFFDTGLDTLVSKYHGLSENPDVMFARAEAMYMQCKFKKCFELTSRILEQDSYNLTALPTHIACMYELNLKTKLFYLGHQLVEKFPTQAVTWFAVGTYYLCVGKCAEGRRYFSKASTMDPGFGPAWIGFAHSFALDGEHDQAISAYSTAAKLFRGIHLPTMFIGMQHLQLHNLGLAEEFLRIAEHVCHGSGFPIPSTSQPPNGGAGDGDGDGEMVLDEVGEEGWGSGRFGRGEGDEAARAKRKKVGKEGGSSVTGSHGDGGGSIGGDPVLENELGVLCYSKSDYRQAIRHFERALAIADDEDARKGRSSVWEVTWCNLGHAYRKLREYPKAREYFEKALGVNPNNAAAYAALALMAHIEGDLDTAILNYHEALSLNPDDSFSSEMLTRALEEVPSRTYPVYNPPTHASDEPTYPSAFTSLLKGKQPATTTLNPPFSTAG